MTKSLSTRQICFILIAYNALLKLLLFPSSAAQSTGNDLIFPALFNLALQTLIIWSVAYLSSKTDKTFYELLVGSIGKAGAKIVYALFAAYFVFAATVPMFEQQLLVHDAFYDTQPSLIIFLPFFFFSVYAGAKSFKNLGRCADIALPVFAVCALCFFIMSVGQGDYSNLLPVLKKPATSLAGASVKSLFRFSESAFLLIFMGHYKYRKGDAAKLTLSYAAGGLIVIVFMGIYYALYGVLTPSRKFLFNNLAVFFPVINFVGRVDLPILYAMDIAVLFAIVMHVQVSVHCLSVALGWEDRAALSLIVNAVLLSAAIIFNNRFSLFFAVAEKWFFIPAIIFAYIIPVLGWALKRGQA